MDMAVQSTFASKPVSRNAGGSAMSEQDLALLETLKSTDRKVRAHEAAHLAAAGGLALSGANFQMEAGPDGQRYAVAGDVRISVGEGRTPEETLRRARLIQAAALAPSDPSSADRAVAAAARAMEMRALGEIASRNATQTRLAGSYQPQDGLVASTFAEAA